MSCPHCKACIQIPAAGANCVESPSHLAKVCIQPDPHVRNATLCIEDLNAKPALPSGTVLTDAVAVTFSSRTTSNRAEVTFANVAYQQHDPTTLKVYVGNLLEAPADWMPVPAADLVRDANARVCGAKVDLHGRTCVVLVA